ncbi:MAG: hypothetical protein OSP8Acid_15940 [uncultured Acidilobus sp. OSP8]|nr:MAG: hypothetical protein OSP8Acid_15940 [uncultured Acidilobus sp. OSP8]
MDTIDIGEGGGIEGLASLAVLRLQFTEGA